MGPWRAEEYGAMYDGSNTFSNFSVSVSGVNFPHFSKSVGSANLHTKKYGSVGKVWLNCVTVTNFELSLCRKT